MSRWHIPVVVLALGAFLAPSSQAMRFHRKPTSGHVHKTVGKAAKHPAAKVHGQQNIDSDRAKQIQTALVREHYLNAEPTGVWDDASKDAMVRYQADHGWQTKVTPDSRALIKLGLGPEQSTAAAATQTASTAAAASHASSAPVQTAAQTTPPHTLGSAITAHSSSPQNLILPQ